MKEGLWNGYWQTGEAWLDDENKYIGLTILIDSRELTADSGWLGPDNTLCIRASCKQIKSAVESRADMELGALRQQLEGSQEQLQDCQAQLQGCRAQLRAAAQLLADARRNGDRMLAAAETARALAIAAPLAAASLYTELHVHTLEAADPVYRLVAGLFCDTAASHRMNLHSDTFFPAPLFQVSRIEVVRNPSLVRQYLAKLEDMEGLRRSGCAGIPELAHLKIPARRGALPTWPDLNEHYLFHGATPSVLQEIVRGGFDPRRGGESAGRMFGLAAYFAANSSKSDIYTERAPKQAQRQMLVARVLMGESHRALRSMPQATRPPNGADGACLDSMWAETRARGGAVDHHEVMIFERTQAYPEYIVTYRHKAECECAECCKRPRQ